MFNKVTLKRISLLLSVMMIILSFPVITSNAATTGQQTGAVAPRQTGAGTALPAGTVIYFDNSVCKWSKANLTSTFSDDNIYMSIVASANVNIAPANVANYKCSSDTWITMTSIGNNIYKATLPTGGAPNGQVSFWSKSMSNWNNPSSAYCAICVPLDTRTNFCVQPGTTYTIGNSTVHIATTLNYSSYSSGATTPPQYTVTYDSQGGSTVPTQVATSGATVVAPTPPTKTGYTFNNWYTAASGGTQISFPYTVTGNVTLYAHWTVNNYTVSGTVSGLSNNVGVTVNYSINSGATQNVTTTTGGAYTISGVPYGASIVITPTSQTGYTSPSAITISSMPASNQTGQNLAYTIIGNTVTYDSQGGSAVPTQVASSGATIVAPTPPTKTGYTFNGWYTAASGGTQITFPYTVTTDVTFYAQWTINSYTVTYDSQGGSTVPTQVATYNTTLVAPTPPTKSGYIFAGWYTAASGGTLITFPYTVTSNVTLYAQWTVTVTFDSQGGSTIPTQVVVQNSTITTPATPTKSGYTFNGWYTAASGGTQITFPYTVTSNVTLYAQWTSTTVTLYFDNSISQWANVNIYSWGNQVAVQSMTLVSGSTTVYTITIDKTGISGFLFKETNNTTTWDKKTNDLTFPTDSTNCYKTTSSTSPVSGSWVTYPYSFTVTFDSQGGSTVPTQVASSGATIVAPTPPTKTGYTFNGWYTAASGGTSVSFPYTVSSNVTLYAQWTINNYTVTFDSQGGSTVSSQSVPYNTTASQPSDPTKTGYTFSGWFTAATGGTSVSWSTAITGNVTYYAQWTINNYTVSFDTQGGSTISSQSVAYNTTASQPSDPTKTGYTFNGWFTAATGGTSVSWSTLITANVTYYAQWTINNYTVTFDSQGGSTVSSQSVPYNTTASQPSDPTKTGYTFNGWFTAATGGTSVSWSTSITANVTYYAQWTINNYTVTFDSQGGSTVSSQSVTYNTTASQPSAPSRAAYTFKGWYTTASGGSPISWSTPITADVTYYAQWTMNTYTVVYHYTDASGNSASSTAVTISTGNVPVMQDLLDDANNHISGTGNYNNTWSSNGTTGCIISNNGLNYDFYSTYTYTCTIHYVYKDRSSISGTDTFDNAPDKTYSTSSGYTINNTSGVNLAPTVGNVSGSDMAPEISNVVYDYYWYLGSLTKNADGTYTLTADSEYHPYIVTILYNGNTYSTTTYNYQDNVALNALNILQGSDKFGQWLQADGTLSTPVFTLLSTSYAYAFRATQNNLIVKLVVKSDSASQVASYTGIELDPCVYESLVNGSTTTIQGGFLITEHFANGSTESRTTIKKYGILRYLITSNGGTTNASFSTAQFLSVAGGTAVSGITNVCIYDSVAGTGTNVNTNNAIIYRVSLTDNSTNEQKVYGIVAYMIDSNGNIYLSNNITNTPSTAGMTTTIQKFDIANRNNPYDPTNGIYPTITTT